MQRLFIGTFALATFVLGISASPSVCQEKQAPRATTHMVAMRDGVKLATDVYLPGDGMDKYPIIVMRTPYNKNGGAGAAANATRRGYALVAQDMRGRFKSEGHHAIIFGNDGWGEHQDGKDTLEWIARQPWCNGKIGSWGASALGITQNMAAPAAPDELKAQHVSVAFSDYYSQGAYQGGAFRTQLIERWLQATGMVEKNLETFVAHPLYDDFWKALNSETRAAKVRAPAVYAGGWYDIFLQGTINSFTAVHYHGGEGARGKCRLVIGPIGHGQITELKYPANAGQGPACGDAFAWFDYVLQGKKNAAAREKAVHYYVMGDPTDPKAPGNYWRHVDDWPPPSTPTPFYFHAHGTLSKQKPEGDVSKTYTYDPKNPVPNIGGQELGVPLGPKDQRKVEDRPDVLLFSTEELKEPLEVTGRLAAKLFVSSDCPDTDFTVKLCDVYPDGRSMLVTDGILRARYHKSFEKESFLGPGQVYELNLDLWSTSLVFNKGHRIRVAVSSSNSPRFEANPNTGKPFRADKETRVARNTLHLSAKHASALVLPVHEGERPAAEQMAKKGHWARAPSLLTDHAFHAAVTVDGKIYVVGGGADVEMLDPTRNAWESLGKSPSDCDFPGAAALGKQIYVIGGVGGKNDLATVDVFDVASRAWQAGVPLQVARSRLAAVVYGGKLYALGGYIGHNENTPVVEEYDPAKRSWVKKASMPVPLHGHAAVVVNNRILVIGGYRFDSGRMSAWNGLEEYDPETDRWRTRSAMPGGGRGFLAAAVADGKVFAIGGHHDQFRLERYDPETDRWRALEPPPDAFERGGTVTLGNDIYLIGGEISPRAVWRFRPPSD